MKGKRPTKQPMSGAPAQKGATGKTGEVDLTHMPQFIKQAPWYLDQTDDAPALAHQR